MAQVNLPPGWRQTLGTPDGLFNGEPVICEWRRDVRPGLVATVTVDAAGFAVDMQGKITINNRGGSARGWTIKAHHTTFPEALAAAPKLCAALDALVAE